MMFVLNGDFVRKHRDIHPETDPHLHLKIFFVTPRLNKSRKQICVFIYDIHIYIYISDKEKHQEVDDGDEGFLVFPPIFCFLETSLRNSQDSPVRLGIMDFLPFSFEAAGLLVVCWWILDVCSWRFLGSCGLFHLHSGNLPGPSKGCQMDGKGFWMSCLT